MSVTPLVKIDWVTNVGHMHIYRWHGAAKWSMHKNVYKIQEEVTSDFFFVKKWNKSIREEAETFILI